MYKTIYDKLDTLGYHVILENTKENIVYPYIQYKLGDGIDMSDYIQHSLELNIWDLDDDSYSNVIDIAKEIVSLLSYTVLYSITDDNYMLIRPNIEGIVIDSELNVKRYRIIFNTKLYK